MDLIAASLDTMDLTRCERKGDGYLVYIAYNK